MTILVECMHMVVLCTDHACVSLLVIRSTLTLRTANKGKGITGGRKRLGLTAHLKGKPVTLASETLDSHKVNSLITVPGESFRVKKWSMLLPFLLE